jgi:serine O-acetyltransferase
MMMPAMRTTLGLIRSDLRAKAQWLYESTTARSQIKALASDGTAAMVLYRLMQGSRRAGLPILEMVFNKLNTTVGGCIIGRGAEFGPGFVLVHSQGVVINGMVRGGAHVKIEHQVTIGAEKRRSPVIGDGVFIGAGAKIVGGVTIGSGARVGANAVVVHDIPPDVSAVGIPARPVARRTTAAPGDPTLESNAA